MSKRVRERKPKGSGRIKTPELPVSTDRQKPIFCLQSLQGEFCLSKCEKDEKAAFADTLHQLSQRTWVELKQINRHKAGFEIIDRKKIRSGIPDFVTPDTNLIAFRFSGLKSMVGYRLRSVFHILWLDRDFTLYDHG